VLLETSSRAAYSHPLLETSSAAEHLRVAYILAVLPPRTGTGGCTSQHTYCTRSSLLPTSTPLQLH
jgi:hypothetical protein